MASIDHPDRILAGLWKQGDLTSPLESGVDEHQDSSGNSPAWNFLAGRCETANLGGNP